MDTRKKRARLENQFTESVYTPSKTVLSAEYLGNSKWKVCGSFGDHFVTEYQDGTKKKFVCDCNGKSENSYKCKHIGGVIMKMYIDYADVIVGESKEIDILENLMSNLKL